MSTNIDINTPIKPSSSSNNDDDYDDDAINDIEQRIIELENCLMGHQVLSLDDLLRTPLPYITTTTNSSSPSTLRRQTSPSTSSSSSSTTTIISNTNLVDTTLQSGSCISEQLDRYRSQINNIKTDNDTINSFLNLYKDNETLFNTVMDNDAIGNGGLITSVEKLAIILSSEDDIKQTARYLQLLSELEKFINSNSVSSIPSSITALKPLQSFHNEQQAITVALNKKLEQKIQSYNDIVEALSTRFAYWDMILSEYEKSLGRGEL
ncbi:putative dynactin 22 kDa subunit [Cavenderia fasciculata]|uniref:Dynactin 22 kDa subunit n=1 Tax=Cavenderia fasciculata TaxID=261658 RepID=F4QEE8_CACFS|nr:putative dynactin 22 kDa subunit [Cavenderia fasciculata]EGG13261.1 putative dynactin 22 kDa subunit [Cavenderia fasciculata]|eukprot:XP_004349960.1 putative dynactin 22 kDa subunit [Cavenderia fasciculata]